jgi:hypothetical protein
MFDSQLVCELTRAVRRVVIHDEKIDAYREREKTIRECREVFAFVVGRDDDKVLVHSGDAR